MWGEKSLVLRGQEGGGVALQRLGGVGRAGLVLAKDSPTARQEADAHDFVYTLWDVAIMPTSTIYNQLCLGN